MKTEKCNSTSHWSWRAVGLAVFVICLGIYIWLPHRAYHLEAKTTLQGGQQMSVQFKVQSTWGWTAPSRLVDMKVQINQRDLPIEKKAYYGLGPIDTNKKPIITTHRGFPDLALWGRPESGLGQIHWRFLNFSFSEVRIQRNDHTEVAYFAEPLPPPVARSLLPQKPRPPIYLSTNKIFPISPEEIAKHKAGL
jgi:hypothetical protein